jgi:hypothetical protein
MSRTRKVLVVTAFVLLIMALLFGCARLFWDVAGQSGWYIRLNIGNPGAKTIGVEEYDVTQVDVGIFAPGETLPFYTVSWYADDGSASYLIPVSEQGEYRIEVTHVGDDNGEPVEAKESATFNIQAMVITVIDIIPGCIGTINVEPGDEEPTTPIDLTGYWVWFFTPDGEQEEFGPITFGIKQTDSSLVTDLEDFSGSYDGSDFFLDSSFLNVHLTGTVSGSGEEIEITGTFTGEILGGSGTFRIVPFPDEIFGTLYAEGTVNEVDILINTNFALGEGGEMETEPFPFSSFEVNGWDPLLWVWAPDGKYLTLWLHVNGALTETQYTWGDWWFSIEWESPSGNLEHYLPSGPTEGTLDITYFDLDVGIAGTFNASCDDWGSLEGNFNVHFYDEWEPEGD